VIQKSDNCLGSCKIFGVQIFAEEAKFFTAMSSLLRAFAGRNPFQSSWNFLFAWFAIAGWRSQGDTRKHLYQMKHGKVSCHLITNDFTSSKTKWILVHLSHWVCNEIKGIGQPFWISSKLGYQKRGGTDLSEPVKAATPRTSFKMAKRGMGREKGRLQPQLAPNQPVFVPFLCH
jgi:hypothetical protein